MQASEQQSVRLTTLAVVETIDRDNQPQSVAQPPDEIQFEFPLITGSIDGAANTGNILVEHVRLGETFQLDLARLQAGAARLAAPLNPRMADAGMTVQPRNARFARVATFGMATSAGAPRFATGFLDPQSRQHLILVYFDEPCRISGALRMLSAEGTYDIVIPSRGFHWISVRKIDDAHYHLTHTGWHDRVVLGIRPLPSAPTKQGA